MSRRTRKTATVSSAGADGGQPVGQRARGVGAVQQVNHALGGADGGNAEERADAVEKQDQHHQTRRWWPAAAAPRRSR